MIINVIPDISTICRSSICGLCSKILKPCIIGICVISGLTGAAGFDAILTSIQRGAFKINLSTELEDKDKEKPKEG